MRRPLLYLVLVFITTTVALAEKTEWTSWLPAKSAKNYSGRIVSDRFDFSYRWRLSTPCTNKDCSIDLQLRNNSDERESLNYTFWVEKESGTAVSDRGHRNFDPHEVQDVPVNKQGQKITGVKIE